MRRGPDPDLEFKAQTNRLSCCTLYGMSAGHPTFGAVKQIADFIVCELDGQVQFTETWLETHREACLDPWNRYSLYNNCRMQAERKQNKTSGAGNVWCENWEPNR